MGDALFVLLLVPALCWVACLAIPSALRDAVDQGRISEEQFGDQVRIFRTVRRIAGVLVVAAVCANLVLVGW